MPSWVETTELELSITRAVTPDLSLNRAAAGSEMRGTSRDSVLPAHRSRQTLTFLYHQLSHALLGSRTVRNCGTVTDLSILSFSQISNFCLCTNQVR